MQARHIFKILLYFVGFFFFFSELIVNYRYSQPEALNTRMDKKACLLSICFGNSKKKKKKYVLPALPLPNNNKQVYGRIKITSCLPVSYEAA